VVNAAQIETVLFGEDGVATSATDNAVVMLCSTIAPEDTITFANRLAKHDIVILDAPISGGPARALSGSMSIMLAGEEVHIQRHQPVLDALSDKIFRLGNVIGDGAKSKLVNNLLAGINLVGAAEAMALGIKLGLEPHRLLALINASSGQSMIGEDRMTRALQQDFAPRAFAHILSKDIALAVAMADTIGHDTPLAAQALEIFKATLARGYSELDDAAVLKTYLE
jgi:3-hydroxyisobutyrate dehydrogenase-like beta-hydroxyacid dehydrogenase